MCDGIEAFLTRRGIAMDFTEDVAGIEQKVSIWFSIVANLDCKLIRMCYW